MDEKINHILSEKTCVYWNIDVFTKLFEDYKLNYGKRHVLYNQFLYTLENGKNYVDKVRILLKHFLYIWSVNNKVISDIELHSIWKTYVHNFSSIERSLIVKHIKSTLEVSIKNENPKQPYENQKKFENSQKQLENELQEAQYKIEELTSKFSALMEVYNSETEDKKKICEKYNKLENDYFTLSSNYSEVYKMSEFRLQRIDDLSELNGRLKSTIEELRSSREMYRDLYNNNGKY